MLPVIGTELRRDRRSGGELVEVLAKTDFAFDGRSGGTDQIVPLAVGIDTFGWKSGVVIVRIHAINTWSATAVAKVQPINVSLVPEDPSVVYSTGTVLSGGAAPAEVQIPSSTAAGTLLTNLFGDSVGPQVMLQLVWSQGAVPALGTQTFSMSCDLLGRYR